jgi:hypothetical protein
MAQNKTFNVDDYMQYPKQLLLVLKLQENLVPQLFKL